MRRLRSVGQLFLEPRHHAPLVPASGAPIPTSADRAGPLYRIQLTGAAHLADLPAHLLGLFEWQKSARGSVTQQERRHARGAAPPVLTRRFLTTLARRGYKLDSKSRPTTTTAITYAASSLPQNRLSHSAGTTTECFRSGGSTEKLVHWPRQLHSRYGSATVAAAPRAIVEFTLT